MPDVNWLAIVVAAASSLAVGFAWYGVFGKAWMGHTGQSEEKLKSGNPAMIFGLAFVLALVQCFCLAMFFGPEMPVGETTFYGFLTGAGWVATALGVQYLFERRSLTFWLINGGYNIVAFTLFGLILGLIR
ncbi:MAG: DUF1761 domain-containing protein [Hyphomonadaceae bacterium]